MKRFLFLSIFTLALALPQMASAQSAFLSLIDCKFDDGTDKLSTDCTGTLGTIAVDTDWFPSDITIADVKFWNPVKHNFQITCPTATIVNLQVVAPSVTVKEHIFKQGLALGADMPHNFSLMMTSGMSYNIQHKTGTQNCSVIITQSNNHDL